MSRSIGRIGIWSIAIGALLLLIAGCGGNGGNGGSGSCPAAGLDVPDVAGDWLISDPALGSSDCPEAVDDILADVIDNAEGCLFTVSQDGATVTAVDCDDLMYQGCVNEAGLVTLFTTQRDSELGCNVRVDAELGANLTLTPTDGSLLLRIRISGACILRTDCSAVIHATVTEAVEGAAQSTGTVALPSATLRGLLRR
jgi:hypothetical protein